MRLLKGLVLFLAIGGVAALAVATRAIARPLTQIDRITPGMNFAYVRVSGVVLAQPKLDAQSGWLSFVLRDAGGQVRIGAYRKTVQALLADKRMPAAGDRADVEGVLRVRDDDVTLLLNSAEALSITRPAAVPVALAALDALQPGERVSTSGQVRRIRTLGQETRIVTLRDGAASADVLLQDSMLPALREGAWISVTGAVAEYRDARQVLPATAGDVALIDAPPPAPRPIGALTRDLLGEWVTVRAEVIELRPFKLGMRLRLRDDQLDQIDAVAFDRAWQNTPLSSTLASGDVIAVSGVLSEFHGKLELLPEIGADLTR